MGHGQFVKCLNYLEMRSSMPPLSTVCARKSPKSLRDTLVDLSNLYRVAPPSPNPPPVCIIATPLPPSCVSPISPTPNPLSAPMSPTVPLCAPQCSVCTPQCLPLAPQCPASANSDSTLCFDYICGSLTERAARLIPTLHVARRDPIHNLLESPKPKPKTGSPSTLNPSQLHPVHSQATPVIPRQLPGHNPSNPNQRPVITSAPGTLSHLPSQLPCDPNQPQST